MSNRQASTKAPQGPYAGLWRRARRTADRGLWLLWEGPAADPVWRVFSRQSGRLVLSYWPASRRWVAAGQSGRCRGWAEALARAAAVSQHTAPSMNPGP